MHADRESFRRGSLALALALANAIAAGIAGAIDWQIVEIEAADDAISSVAVDPHAGLAVGDSRGVVVRAADGRERRHWLRGAAEHVAFFGSSPDARVLWAATDTGLYQLAAEPRTVVPAPGARAATVSRIATAAGRVALATDEGLFWSRDGFDWQRPEGPPRQASVSALKLRAAEAGAECWAVVRDGLWRLGDAPVRSESDAPRPLQLPFRPGGGDAVDLAFDVDGAEIVVVYASALVARRFGSDPTSAAHWTVQRPALPPGAAIVEIASALGWIWLATDRGLFRARSLAGPWERAAGPLARRPVADLDVGAARASVLTAEPGNAAVEPDALYVATDRGLMVATAGRPQTARFGATGASADPPIGGVHRAALRYLALEPRRVAAMRSGVGKRGWLPIVDVGVAHESDHSRKSDYDEAYISGGLRQLRDNNRDESTDWAVHLSLRWDLGDVAYHPEQIDVSREAREIIELRDEVLDEVTQLYFERQRVLAEVRAQPAASDARPLQFRAEQLAAGIDAWTGGWFSEQIDPPAHPRTGPGEWNP